MIKIAVVMTTYNGESYLEQQIESILSQSLSPDTLIVCDDRSTDSTVEILDKYQRQGKLTYVVNAEQLGLIENFKKAVSLAPQDAYVALSDQDDQWLPDKLEQSARILLEIEDPGLPCMVYTDLMLVDETDRVLNQSFRNELGQDRYHHNLQTLLFGNFVNGCTVLMNPVLRARFAEIPGDIRLNHDGWMALQAYAFGKAQELKIPLVRYRKHNTNVSIAAGTKPRNRYRSTFQQIFNSLTGNDDFLSAQLETVTRFYQTYQTELSATNSDYFRHFMSLQNKHYILKKLAFRKTVKRFLF
jgi:glycosyltransferase involved in cell wall biosynthesis